MSDFVHLHLHTEYSLLDGATRISKIADKAISLGQSAVAITDHGVMYGAVEFYKELKKKGVKPIIGCEAYVAPRGRFMKEGKADSSGNHLILLCKNAVGYKNLCYMVSESFINGFYSRPRIDLSLLREHHEGLIALSGCIGGKIPQLILAGSMAEAENAALEMREIFGEDFYLEIQNHGITEERQTAFGLKLISEKLGIPLVATNDVHYLEKKDADTQATLMCIQTNSVITDGRPSGFSTDEFYFKSAEEMEALFAPYAGAVENTVKIAEKCNFDFEFNNLHLPTFEPEDNLSHKDKLRKDAYLGFEQKVRGGRFDFEKNPREFYIERLEYELSVIDKMGFNAYFLIVSDFVAFAKNSDIPVGPGRGSGAGSLVAFCIGITDVDPIAFDLLFERFLNPERVSMPDFDIDFCYNRREEVIEYVKRKYGEDRVAQIVTFGTLAPRAAVRDVGRALGMPYSAVDPIAKLIPSDSQSIDDALNNKELRSLYMSDNEVRRLIDVSRGVEGMPRHASTHAAGVVITEKPTWEYVPLSYSGTGVVTQFDMTTSAELGLVKFDFLGLRYITVIHDAEREIRKRVPSFDITTVPFDDKKTFKLLCDAKSDGVFQLESGGMKAVLTRLAPTCFEDIIACIALFRPGPMDSIDKFIARKHGRERTEYKIEALRSILDVTYGCIVYQEQVMQICRELAGYSYAHADLVRRAMSKKKEDAMAAEQDAFIKGCLERGIDEADAKEIFDEMVGFAKYAFNKSHATVYGVTSYRTAYLKAHYPAEYFCALLSSVLDNLKKTGEYIADAQKFGVSVLRPDVNFSGVDFTVDNGQIRFGLLAIKNVGRPFAEAVVRERRLGGFKSFDEFVSRLCSADLNKRTLESLIKCGVFDSLGVARSSLLACYEDILESEQTKKRNNISGQIDMFSMAMSGGTDISASGYRYPEIKEFSLKELLFLEKESSGMYFSGHMIDNYSNALEGIRAEKISVILEDFAEDLSENPTYADKSSVTVAGIITEKKTKITKNGTTMAFIKLEDRYAEIEVVVFAKHYSRYADDIFVDNAIAITGNISHEEGEEPRILLSSLTTLPPNGTAAPNTDVGGKSTPQGSASVTSAENGKKSTPQGSAGGAVAEGERAKTVYIKVKSLDDPRINNVHRLSALYRGNAEIVLFDESTKKYSKLRGVTLDPSEKVLEKLISHFGEASVVLR
ncbi:MAG: DNA polymerase III subunit alpha [Clostridia bacterium]|nr:DNA polymerase III subunit alpha [Clostridia bacterium]